jgi:arylsulfatase
VDIAGADYPKVFNGEEINPMQGQSLLPALMGKDKKRRQPLFWEWKDGQAVRDGDWKLVRNGLESEWDLYNVDSDPSETMNLSSQFPERVGEMELLFLQWKEQVNRE